MFDGMEFQSKEMRIFVLKEVLAQSKDCTKKGFESPVEGYSPLQVASIVHYAVKIHFAIWHYWKFKFAFSFIVAAICSGQDPKDAVREARELSVLNLKNPHLPTRDLEVFYFMLQEVYVDSLEEGSDDE